MTEISAVVGSARRGFGVACALVVALEPTSIYAQSGGWRAVRIDASSESSFEASVAALQEQLPPRRREDFEMALTAIWIDNTVHSADFDQDGDVDGEDSRLLGQEVMRVLAAIQRGDLTSVTEESAKTGAVYTATDYLKQLDGLGYDDVLKLAAQLGGDFYIAALGYTGTEPCDQHRSKRCKGLGPMIARPPTAKALAAATEAMHSQKWTEARAAIGKLSLGGLNAYERSKVEQILFTISYAEGNFAEGREHVLAALDTGALTEKEFFAALDCLRLVEAKLAETPQ